MKVNYLELLKKHYSVVAVVLFGVLYIIFFSIANESIESGSRPISEKSKSENKNEDEKEAEVFLNIDRNGMTKTYSAKLSTHTSIGDLFEYLRSKNLIKYESVAYSDGTRITEIDNITNTSSFSWRLFQQTGPDEVEIKDFTKIKLINGGVYRLGYIQK